jgi:hypothetical protein
MAEQVRAGLCSRRQAVCCCWPAGVLLPRKAVFFGSVCCLYMILAVLKGQTALSLRLQTSGSAAAARPA